MLRVLNGSRGLGLRVWACVISIVFGGLVLVSPALAANFDPNFVLHDEALRADDMMTVDDVQAFLVSKKSLLSTRSFPRHDGGASAPASVIIYEAARAWKINPQVLLVLLQKEQTLITRQTLGKTTLDRAVGAGCPNGTTNLYPGFGNQMWNGARLLDKYGEDRTPSTGFAVFKPNTKYNTYTIPVYPRNIATHKLYVYNPSIGAKVPYGDLSSQINTLSGNANFWKIYWNWFGDPTVVPGPPVLRTGGSTRYDVTRSTAMAAYPAWTGVKHVVLASGEDRAQPDALTAAGLAGVLDAPLMLVPYANLNGAIGAAVAGMPAGVAVHVVGGPNSVSDATLKQLAALGNVKSVDRISGANRYSTAAAVAMRMKSEVIAQGKPWVDASIITNGNMPNAMFDALTASAISSHNFYPVLLVKDAAVPAETSQTLADLGLSRRYIIGGTTSVKENVRVALGISPANRISGPDRYSTATAAATRAKAEGWLSNTVIGFAAKVPDAATGGAFMGKNDGALIYVTPTAVPGATAAFLSASSNTATRGEVFGGTTSVPLSVQTQLQRLMR